MTTDIPRTPLPARRPTETRTLEFDGFRLHVTVGLTLDGRAREVFLRLKGEAGKSSFVGRVADDVAVLISHLLQRGMPAADLAAALARRDGYPDSPRDQGRPASFVGALADLAAAVERDAQHGGSTHDDD